MIKSLDDVVTQVLKDFEDSLLSTSGQISKQLIIQARAANYPLEYAQYIYFVFFEESSNWMLPSKRKMPLAIARDIMTLGEKVPPYRDGLLPPPTAEDEQKLDLLLDKTALWVKTKLMATLLAFFDKAVKAHLKEAEPFIPEGVRQSAALSYLTLAVRKKVRERPNRYSSGDLMSSVLSFLF